jgi:hypothetical protein
MMERGREAIAEIIDFRWEETSFVDEGDNPGARILFRKRKGESLLSEEEIIEKAIAEVAGDNESEEPMTELVEKVRNARTQEDVVAAVNEVAERILKQDPVLAELATRNLERARAQARIRVYETHNIVMERSYEGQPDEIAESTSEPEDVEAVAKQQSLAEQTLAVFPIQERQGYRTMSRETIEEAARYYRPGE